MKTAKKLFVFFIAAACITTMLFAKGSNMKAGTYTETVKGMRDGLTVEVKRLRAINLNLKFWPAVITIVTVWAKGQIRMKNRPYCGCP